ncbi:class I SAM-dependent methyltransferase [Jannaschia seohaensis]|nr:class I SAM-dependent methyltransferase [Jannaschia seohaensis]
MAARYAARPVEDPAAYAMKLDMMSDLLRDRPGSQVVEIGCGTGSTALTLAPHADRIRAADVSAAMIEIARDKARDIDPEKLSFEVAAFEDLAVAEGSQDMVMAHSLLHLLERRDAAIAAAHRWLRPGGVFVSSTPCLSEVAPWLRLVAPLARAAGLFPPALGFFTEAELVGALKAHGFEIERRFRPDTRAATFLVARKPA